MLEIVKNKDFSKLKEIDYGFFTRKGGVSIGEYDSLNTNTAITSGESFEQVSKNLNIIQQFFLSPHKVFKMKQIHTNKVILLNNFDYEKSDDLFEGDAVITQLKNVVIGVTTADCVPILVADSENKIIAAIHASWKSTLNGIIENTIMEMKKLGTNAQNITAILGPHLRVDNFEIQNDFIEILTAKNSKNLKFILEKNNKKLFNITECVKTILTDLDIKNIYDVNLDTYTNPDLFFSYRRSCHLNTQSKLGCQFSAIMLN